MLSLQNTQIGGDKNKVYFHFILSHCIHQVEELHLENCQITNEIVRQLGEKILTRSKKVKILFVAQKSIFLGKAVM